MTKRTSTGEEPTPKKLKPDTPITSAKEFRRLLQTEARNTALQDFLTVVRNEELSDDAISEYFECGGSCLELLQLWEVDANCSAVLILELVQHLIVAVIAKHPHMQHVTLEACRYLLNTHLTLVNKMLQLASTAKERLVMLRLLATMVSFSTSLVKDILLNVKFRVVLLNKHMHNLKQSVRLAYIHFLLAFFIDGHYPTIMQLLNKPYMYTCIMPGLKYDPAETVQLVLMTLKSRFVDNAAVSKPVRLRFFTNMVLKGLVHLYDWRGPNCIEEKRQRPTDGDVDVEQKRAIGALTHEILLVLCTSFKHGVIFRDELLGTGAQCRNPLMFNIIEMSFSDEHHSPLQQQLVVRMCGECPDLVKVVWEKLLPMLQPRPTVQWYRAVRFLRQVIGATNPLGTMYNANRRLISPLQYAQVIQILVAPSLILAQLIPAEFEFESPVVRYEVITVMQVILNAVLRFVDAAKQVLPANYHWTLRKLLEDLLQRNLPSAELLVKDWLVIPEAQSDELPQYERVLYMSQVIHVLGLYNQLCPDLLANLKFADVTALLSIDPDEGADKVHHMKVALIQLLSQLEPTLLSVTGSIFPRALEIYATSLRLPPTDNYDAHRCICNLLTLTGLFVGCEYEVVIWADALRHKNMLEFFTQILHTLANQPELSEQFAKLRATFTSSEQVTFDDKPDIILQTLYTQRYTYRWNKQMKHITFSNVVGAALLLNISNKRLKKHLGNVMLHIFHLQTDYRCFQELVSTHRERLPEEVRDYIVKWPEAQVPSVDTSESAGELQSIVETSTAVFKLINDISADVSVLIESAKSHAEQLLDMIYCNSKVFQSFQLKKMESSDLRSNTVTFLTEITESIGEDIDLASYLKPYQHRLFNFTMKIVSERKAESTSKSKNDLESFTKALSVFGLDWLEYTEIFDKIAARDGVDFHDADMKTNQLYSIVLAVLKNFNKLTSECYDEYYAYDGIQKILKILTELNRCNVETSELAAALRVYFARFPSQINAAFQREYFVSVIQKQEYCKENAQLAILIFKVTSTRAHEDANMDDLHPEFFANLEAICQKKGLILLLLDIVHFDAVESEAKTFALLTPMLQKTLAKPSKAGQHMEHHFKGFCSLVEKQVPIAIVKPYLDKAQKADTGEVFLPAIWKAMFTKYLTAVTSGSLEKEANNAILTFVHYLVNMFKGYQKKHGDTENTLDMQKLKDVAGIFGEVIAKLPSNVAPESTRSNENFKLLCKLCLKYGVGATNICFLKLLTLFASTLKFTLDETKELMEMLCGHSEFMNFVLDDMSDAKLAMFDFMDALCNAHSGVMERKHVPLLLSAYTATVHPCDRRVLSLLQLYEGAREQTQFYDFKPFLWGLSAGSFYSVREDSQRALWRRPRTGDVLDILQISVIESTIVHYPLNTPLTGGPMALGLVTELAAKVYDIGFMLAVFTQLLEPENTLITHKFTRSGALSLVVAALASHNREVRKAACHVLAKFFYHMETKRSGKDHPLWLRFIEVVAKATGAVEHHRLNNFAALFMARTALVLTNPTDAMYAPLTNFLGVKSAPNLGGIPELYTFLHSAEVDHSTHRHFILQLLHDGMRTEEDATIAIGTMAFKLIMALYGTAICDAHSKVLILEILERATGFPNTARTLCSTHGLSTWLYNVLRNNSDLETSSLGIRIYEQIKIQVGLEVAMMAEVGIEVEKLLYESNSYSIL